MSKKQQPSLRELFSHFSTRKRRHHPLQLLVAIEVTEGQRLSVETSSGSEEGIHEDKRDSESDEEAEDFPEDPQLAAFLFCEAPPSVLRTMDITVDSFALPSTIVVEEALEPNEDGKSSPYLVLICFLIEKHE